MQLLHPAFESGLRTMLHLNEVRRSFTSALTAFLSGFSSVTETAVPFMRTRR
jgi:hypothetical protein